MPQAWGFGCTLWCGSGISSKSLVGDILSCRHGTQKCYPSFADALRCLRRELWRHRINMMFGKSSVHDANFEFLIEALTTTA